MAWEVAYENQIETWGFWQTEWGRIYAEGFAEDVRKKGRGSGSLYELMPEIESHKLLQADPIYVDKEMEQLWEASQKDFKPEPFEATDLLCQAGFVLLPYAQYMYDVNGKSCSYRAIAWSLTGFDDQRAAHRRADGNEKRYGLGINLSLYTHRDDEDDYSTLWNDIRPGTLGEQLHKYPLTLLHMDNWEFGATFEDAVEDQEKWGRRENLDEEQVKHATLGLYDTWRKVQALFRLMQQKIATPVQEIAPRATRRRAEKKGFKTKPVTVIRLRRPKRPRQSEDAIEVDWSHRWLVGGHWRAQWYPTLGIHRQVYLAPYIKGPEDKPLQIREKRAFELVQ